MMVSGTPNNASTAAISGSKKFRQVILEFGLPLESVRRRIGEPVHLLWVAILKTLYG